jgi:hypothetical protein
LTVVKAPYGVFHGLMMSIGLLLAISYLVLVGSARGSVLPVSSASTSVSTSRHSSEKVRSGMSRTMPTDR